MAQQAWAPGASALALNAPADHPRPPEDLGAAGGEAASYTTAQMYRGVLAHLFLIFIPELQKLQDTLPAQAPGRGLRSRREPRSHSGAPHSWRRAEQVVGLISSHAHRLPSS